MPVFLRVLSSLIFMLSLEVAGASVAIDEFQAGILFRRTQEVLNYRSQGVSTCSDRKDLEPSQKAILVRFKHQFKTHQSIRYSSSKESLEATLELLLKSRIPFCQSEIAKADESLSSLQRKKLRIPLATLKALCYSVPVDRTCHDKVAKILKDLDPFCATQNSPDYFGVKDPNPCMAGDRLLGKTIRMRNDSHQKLMHFFLNALEFKISEAQNGQSIDLWEIFQERHEDTLENRKKFLGLMTFFYYALGTAGGYIDGVADHFWVSPLEERQSPEAIFLEFFNARQKADRYRQIVRQKVADGLDLTMNGKSIRDMNRHDFMAIFLACHFKEDGNLLGRVLPNVLGYGYESLDFISHLRTRVSVKVSVENFRRDTERYRRGSRWGHAFCSSSL